MDECVEESTAPADEDPLETVVENLGRSVGALLFESAWMLRRKDAIELLDDTWVRRTTSVDLSIPRELSAITPATGGAPGLYAVPVTMLPKVPPSLMRFDFRNGDARLTMPTRRQNGLAAYAALLWAVRRVLGKEKWPLHPRLREELLFVAVGPPEYATRVSFRIRAPGRYGDPPRLPKLQEMPTLEEGENELLMWFSSMAGTDMPSRAVDSHTHVSGEALARIHVALSEDPRTAWLLRKFAGSSPVVAHVPRDATGRQRILLAYDENVYKNHESIGQEYVATYGWASYPLNIQSPYVGASSFHFEFLAPSGLEVSSSLLVELWPDADDFDFISEDEESEEDEEVAVDDLDEERGWPEYDFTPSRGTRVHHYWPSSSTIDGVSAQVYLRVAREGFVGSAFWAALAVAGTISICAAFAQPLVRHAAGAETLLLAFPGLLAAVVARAGGHPLIIRLLTRARRALLWSAALAFIAAGLLAFIPTGGTANAGPGVYGFYGTCAALATWEAAKLCLTRMLPRPGGGGWPERLVGRIALHQQRKARRKARRRQRSLRLMVRAPGLTWERAGEVAAASKARPYQREVPVLVGPYQRWPFTQDPHLCLAKTLDGGPLLSTRARYTDRWLSQSVENARALAATVRWLGTQFPGGYELEVYWLPMRRRARLFAYRAWRNAIGRDPGSAGLPRRPAQDVEEVASAARRGAIRLRRVYVVTVAKDTEKATETDSGQGLATTTDNGSAGTAPDAAATTEGER